MRAGGSEAGAFWKILLSYCLDLEGEVRVQNEPGHAVCVIVAWFEMCKRMNQVMAKRKGSVLFMSANCSGSIVTDNISSTWKVIPRLVRTSLYAPSPKAGLGSRS